MKREPFGSFETDTRNVCGMRTHSSLLMMGKRRGEEITIVDAS